MNFSFTAQFKKDIKKLKSENIKYLSKVLELIESIDSNQENRLKGIGQPELLKGNLAGCYSRRIT